MIYNSPKSFKIEKLTTLIFAILASSVIFLSMPIFSLDGLFPIVDSQILFLNIFCSSLFFYNFILIAFFKKEIINIFNPINLLPLLIGFISIISSFFSSNPILSLTGSAQIGQGAFWYFGLGIILITLTRNNFSEKEKTFLFCLLFLITTIVTFFTINPFWKGLPISFFSFSDYLSFFGASVFILLTLKTNNFFFLSVGYLSLGFFFHLVDNNAAKLVWVSTLIMAISYFTLHKYRKIGYGYVEKVKNILFSNIFFALYIVIISFLILLLSIVFWPGEGKLPLHFEGLPIASLMVRGKIAEVSLYSLGNVKNLLIGNGWGVIPELLLANMDAWQYDQLKVGYNLHYHTHNEVIEHFVSIGLFGFVLFILFIYFIFRLTEEHGIFTRLAWLLFFKISCFWFFWAATLPLMALTLACSVKDFNKIKFYHRVKSFTKEYDSETRKFLSIMYVCLGLFLLYGSYLTYQSSVISKKITYSQFLKFANDNKDYRKTCANFYNDHGRGGFYLTTFIATYSSYYLQKLEERDDESDKVLDMVNCIVDDLIFSDRAMNSLISASLQVEAKSYANAKKRLSEKQLQIYRENNYERWLKKILIIDDKIPKRDDFLLTFLSFSLEAGDVDGAEKVCVRKKRDKIDAFCNLIFAYKYLNKENLKKSDISKGVFYVKEAINKGVLNEKLYGWWLNEDFTYGDSFRGFSPEGIPMSPDKLFLISDFEGKRLVELIQNF